MILATDPIPMIPILLLAAALLTLSGPLPAQPPAPHLTGDVNVDLPSGMISADVCLSNLPRLDTIRFLPHTGLNVRSIRDGKGEAISHTSDRVVVIGVAGNVKEQDIRDAAYPEAYFPLAAMTTGGATRVTVKTGMGPAGFLGE